MPELVADCPRCRTLKMTFDVTQAHFIVANYEWQKCYEVFAICRACNRSTTFKVAQKEVAYGRIIEQIGLMGLTVAINRYMHVEGFVSLKDRVGIPAPEHLPPELNSIFKEAATSLAVNCYNAAGTMFRLCLDLATKEKLPQDETAGLSAKVRRDLGLRLPWLFDNNMLPSDLRDLSSCVKEDGNDGAHKGTLTEAEAQDLLDFTTNLLERLYTEPGRLKLAKTRRDERRNPTK